MSINHFSSDHPAETQWWTRAAQQEEGHFGHSQFYNNQQHNYQAWLNSHPQQQQQHQQASASASSMSAFQIPTLNFNLNHHHDQNANNEPEEEDLDADADYDKEPMFEKPLTPSDVGKLNRLVIPKQHAEKYFPLGGGGGDSAGEKGLLLSFEDESGKCWRFRYSYWNSSQSYVLTKGWSRYVKEKRLDAGDVVLFERRRTNSDHLFIGWRRRSQAQDSGGGAASAAAQVSGGGVVESGGSSGISRVGGSGAGAGWTRMFYSAHPSYPAHEYQHSVPYPPDSLHAAGPSVHQNHQTTTSGGSSSKILRLFGVNLECQQAVDHESEPSTPDGSSSLSSGQGPTQQQLYPRAYYADHRDITFSSSRDVIPMRNRRG